MLYWIMDVGMDKLIKEYDGIKIPYENGSFDTVIDIAVMRHTDFHLMFDRDLHSIVVLETT